MNWVKSRNDLCHDDSTVNIVPCIVIIITVDIIYKPALLCLRIPPVNSADLLNIYVLDHLIIFLCNYITLQNKIITLIHM